MNFDCYGETTFSCQNCQEGCCHLFEISVTASERDSIMKLWIPEMSTPPEKWFIPTGKGDFKPAKDAKTKGCIFLDSHNRCKLHTCYGMKTKPFSCRVFPLLINNWADGHISAEYRFICPAVGKIGGKPLKEVLHTLPRLAEEMSERRHLVDPIYAKNNRAKLNKIRYVHAAYSALLHDNSMSWKFRFYMVARILDFHSKRSIREAISLADASFVPEALEFAAKAKNALEKELSDGTINKSQRTNFGNILCGFLRDDDPKVARKISFRLNRVWTHLRIVIFGNGLLSEMNSKAPAIAGKIFPWSGTYHKLTPEAEEVFKMFFYGKLDSMHFCGSAAHGYSYEEGMRLLLAAGAVAFALANAYATERGSSEIAYEDMYKSVHLLDFTFARSPFFEATLVKSWLSQLIKPKNFAGILNECVRC